MWTVFQSEPPGGHTRGGVCAKFIGQAVVLTTWSDRGDLLKVMCVQVQLVGVDLFKVRCEDNFAQPEWTCLR